MKLTFGQKIRRVRLFLKAIFSSYERDMALSILQKAKIKNPVIIDIGANIGLFSKAFANSNYQPKLILAFEPSPYIFDILTVALKKFKNVRCFKIALADRKGSTMLNMPVKNTGAIRVGLSHIGNVNKSENFISTKVRTERIDDFLYENFNFDVHIIKMDVEGAEGLVIEGASRLLKQVRPFWYVEISDTPGRFEKNGPDIFQIFIKNGYVPHLHYGADQWVKQNEVTIGKDYLFIPKEKIK